MRLSERLWGFLFQKKPVRWEAADRPSEFRTSARHIAIIMDGNGRWAQRRGLPRTEGHRQGLARAKEIAAAVLELNIPYLTLYAFSTENWKRPSEEVGFLMGLFKRVLREDVQELKEKQIRLRFLGFRDNLDPELRRLMEEAECVTAECSRLQLNLALNYGGRAEIANAVRTLARKVRSGELSPDAIDESLIEKHLFTGGIPDPDLLIRPSGELRISNFLLWQCAYTEFYFTPVLWPDFQRDTLLEALIDFNRRKRRFGGI